MNLLIGAENHRDHFYPIFLDNLNVGEADEWSSEGEKYHAYFDLTFIKLSTHSAIREVFSHNIGTFSFEINTTKYPSLKWVSHASSTWFHNDLICNVNIIPDFLGWDNSISLSNVID